MPHTTIQSGSMTAASFYLGLGAVCLFAATLFFWDLNGTDLWSSHEARAGQNAQRMIEDGTWGSLQLFDGQYDFQKPPAFYWMVASIARAKGGQVDRWSVRLPAACSAVALVLILALYLKNQGHPLAALASSFTLATSIHFTSAARTGRIDMPLTLATSVAVLALLPRSHACTADHGTGRRIWVSVIAALALAWGMLLKGPIALLLPVAVIISMRLIYLVLRVPTYPGSARLILILVSAMALAAPWYVWIDRHSGGEFTRVFFWHHNIERATGSSATLAVHPWWYYIPRFFIDFLPATPFLMFMLFSWVMDAGFRRQEFAHVGLVWLAIMLGLLSFAKFKRSDYLLPAYPGAALGIGTFVEYHAGRLSLASRRKLFLLAVSIALSCLAGWYWFHSTIEKKMEARAAQSDFALVIRQHAPAPVPVTLFRVEAHLLTFHLGRPVHTLVEWSDLRNLLAQSGVHWFITSPDLVAECCEQIPSRRITVIACSADFTKRNPHRPLVLCCAFDNHE